MKKSIYLFLSIFMIFGCSLETSQCHKENENTVSLVCWNLQTFFDAETTGTEYSEFIKNPDWNRDAYQNRLNRLCSAISTLKADIFVFQEVENSNVIIDISNKLQTNAWNSKDLWHYSCFAKKEGTSIGIAILSKFPLENLKTHYLQIQSQKEIQPQSRLLVEVQAKIKEKTLTIFANHWKSKSGGQAQTEIWRDWQELQMTQQLQKCNQNDKVVICGDFNRDACEFVCDFSGNYKDYNTIFRGVSEKCKSIENIKVYSPWFLQNGSYATQTGSYFFNDCWERIDNIFCYGDIKIMGFSPKITENWATSEGIPKKFLIYSGNGYSDHLPIMCNLVL